MRREPQAGIAVAPPTKQGPAKSSRNRSLRDPLERAVTGLNHFNITASPTLIEQVKRFYHDVLGLKIGPRAHLDHSGYWLYAGSSPILHLSACPDLEGSAVTCKGFFNHISLSCTGLGATMAHLIAIGIPYQVRQLSDLDQTQIFITDPAGIGVELTFFNESL